MVQLLLNSQILFSKQVNSAVDHIQLSDRDIKQSAMRYGTNESRKNQGYINFDPLFSSHVKEPPKTTNINRPLNPLIFAPLALPQHHLLRLNK